MSCGACAPEAFREDGGVVYGYLVASSVEQAALDARNLYFMGAEHVFADEPRGHIQHRPSFNKLTRKFLRSGDKLVLATEQALGTKAHRADRHIEALEGQGVQVAILRSEYFQNEQS